MLFAVLYMSKYISRITAEETPILLAVVGKLEKQFFVFIGSLEEWSAVEIPLGQEGRSFPRVAGLRTGLDPAAFLHIRGKIFVYSHVFFGEKIVILVIGVEVFHDFSVERNFEDPFISLYFDIAVIRGCIYRSRQCPAQFEKDE